MEKNRVLFLIHTLGGGGAERALVNLVNNMDRDKYDITVETMFGDGVNLRYLLPHIQYLPKKAPCPKGISIILKFLSPKLLYKSFIGNNQYDVMVAYMHGAPIKTIAGGKKAGTIAWLHNGNPETSTMFRCWLSEKNAFKDYASFDRIVAVSESVSEAFSKYTGIADPEVIYNTLDVKRIKEQSLELPSVSFDSSYINIVSTGRLAKEKGIPYQYEVMGGKTGTNADMIAVSKGGIKTVTVSVPERYMHTPAEVIDLNDTENTAVLISEYIKGLE